MMIMDERTFHSVTIFEKVLNSDPREVIQCRPDNLESIRGLKSFRLLPVYREDPYIEE